MPTVRGIDFDRVRDIGVSPGGDITSAVQSADDGTLLDIPPGEYTFSPTVKVNGRRNIGIRGTGDYGETVLRGRSGWQVAFDWDNTRNLLVENVSFDLTQNFDRFYVQTFNGASGRVVFESVEWKGAYPNENMVDGYGSLVQVQGGDGTFVVNNCLCRGRHRRAGYPNNYGFMLFQLDNGLEPVVTNTAIVNGPGSNGIYANNSPTPATFRNCYFQNVPHTGLRLGRGDHVVEDSVFFYDRNVWESDGNRGYPGTVNRALWCFRTYGSARPPKVRNCDFYMANGFPDIAGIVVQRNNNNGGNVGGPIVDDCRFYTDGAPAVAGRNYTPNEPLTVRRSAFHGPGTYITSNRDAIAEDCCFDDSGSVSGVSVSGSAVMCDEPPMSPLDPFQFVGGGEPECGPDTDNTCPPTAECQDGRCVYPEPSDHELLVLGGGGTVRYTFDVNGHVEGGGEADLEGGDWDRVNRRDDGTETVTGVTGSGGAGDTWVLDGQVTSFEFTEGSGTIEFDGQEVSPGDFPLPTCVGDGDCAGDMVCKDGECVDPGGPTGPGLRQAAIFVGAAGIGLGVARRMLEER